MDYKELEKLAVEVRQDIIKSLVDVGSGHSAGPLGNVDILLALFFEVLKHNPKNPQWPERDRFVISNGHTCPGLYAVMAHAGYFPKEELFSLRNFGSRLQGHPHRESLPSLETTSGPLGSGLSQACGMSLASKLDNKKYNIFCLMSDGEFDEGNTWEAVMFAAKYKLSNLTAIIDRNNIQIDGFTEEVMPLEPLKAKLEAFNWHVLEVDGHNFEQIVGACEEAKAIFEKPVMIIAHTIPGKGVDFMEFDPKWHGLPPNAGEAVEALRELRTLKGKLEEE
ncbi:MAG: Transketolase domain protein [Parcubacteria group bacterium GW2011_GWB1_45_7]|nr:MAG: Transketolase domain protein [Parcubacteria group bacterium GW2011_GWA1_Parcubacteria_45_10]KKU11065.1 MAG: Transketolase domain protein [Parcubacteria group bacterium GW2011_GWB1_45_7]